MQIGMIGLGRMGGNMARRLTKGGHQCVVFDRNRENVNALAKEGPAPAYSLEELVEKLSAPRAVWVMLPSGAPTEETVVALSRLLESGDTIIDGGNSYYVDDIRRAKELVSKGIHYVDVGTSGGIWGLERGYCMMIGGERPIIQQLDQIFATLAPGIGSIPRTPGREKLGGTAEKGYLHCGQNGAGHFVKMVHNGIEYGLMAAYAEGLGVLKSANAGASQSEADAETTSLRDPECYQYDLNLTDIVEVWRRGSVIGSWLLDLTASALAADAKLTKFAGRVSDSGEGRWTIKAAIDEGVPVPVLTTALYERAANPEGLPIEVFDKIRADLIKDPSQYYKDLAMAFYGANRPGARVSQGILDQFWLWSMQAGLLNAYESIKAFSETDFTEDLKKFDVPTLVMHGEDDQIVPIKDSAKKSAKLIKGSQEIYYPGAPHGLTATHADRVNSDLLKFLQQDQQARKAA